MMHFIKHIYTWGDLEDIISNSFFYLILYDSTIFTIKSTKKKQILSKRLNVSII